MRIPMRTMIMPEPATVATQATDTRTPTPSSAENLGHGDRCVDCLRTADQGRAMMHCTLRLRHHWPRGAAATYRRHLR